MTSEVEVRERARAWDRAMISNDADAIGLFMADEWVIVGSDGHVTDRAGFLEQIRSGRLTHNVMTTEDAQVTVYNDVATLVARGVSSGHYDGLEFREVERQSNVFVRRDGEWRCVLTHLSRIS